MGGRLIDWLGQGLAADRPAAAGVAALTNAQGAVLYFANDTKILSIYDDSGPAWFDVDIAGLASVSFETLPDVDWAVPPTDGQFFVWDDTAGKLEPFSFVNGTGIDIDGDLVLRTLTINSTITQYTDEMAMDAIGTAIASGTHIGIVINYDDALNKFDFEVQTSFVEGLADGRIAAASISDLIDVDTTGVSDGEVLSWVAANNRFETAAPGSAASGRYLGTQILTGAGTLTTVAGTNRVVIEGVGPGGGGSGADAPSAGAVCVGRSGGGGGYFLKELTANFEGGAYSVGTGGVAGAAANGAGGAGSDTTFTDTAANTYTAGAGGGGSTPFSATNEYITNLGGSGGVATGGDLNIPGQHGSAGHNAPGGVSAFSSPGGDSKMGYGGAGRRVGTANTSQAGSTGTGYGGGGSGGCCNGTAAAVAGGAGADGILLVHQYS